MIPALSSVGSFRFKLLVCFQAPGQFDDLFWIDLAGFDEAHYQLFAGSAEHAVHEVAKSVP
jgi:hypothetical protein